MLSLGARVLFGLAVLVIASMVGLGVLIAMLKAAPAAIHAQSFTPFLPPSYPLAVRNPYLQAWLPGNRVATLPSATPQFWYGNDLGWAILARVDGITYSLLGEPSFPAATVVGGHFTATHSIFTLTAGNAHITLDFFSPVSFKDYLRQSLPFSYLTVSVSGLNDASPTVQIYSDIDESWTGQSGNTVYEFTTNANASIYQLSAASQAVYSQSPNEQALWGEAVFASGTVHPLVAASGVSASIRDEFQSTGTLGGLQPSWASGNVAALAHNLSTITTETSVNLAIGYVRDAAVNYLGTPQTHYYRARYPDTVSAVVHFLNDYSAAAAESSTLDSQISSTGASLAGQNYSDILSLSVIQTFGGIDVTIDGETLDTTNISAFVKEISSNGNVNTIDIIVELLPFFWIFNPEYLIHLLDPVVNYLESGRWPHPFTIHDIGTHYPNATGHDDGNAEQMPVEESGNLLIMAAAYQAVTGSSIWTNAHSKLFSSYADYLIANGRYPSNQLSTNDGLGSFANMTQLGVKAAVALSAYGSAISNSTLTSTASSFVSTIYTVGTGVQISPLTNQTYFTLTYNSTPFFLLFNLYPDRLLSSLPNSTSPIFPSEAFTGQSALYPNVRGPYGVPITGTVEWGKTDWQLWSAAVAEPEVRQQIVDDLWRYVSDGQSDVPFADRYWVTGNEAGQGAEGFRARPVLGAHFAIWALEGGGGQ